MVTATSDGRYAYTGQTHELQEKANEIYNTPVRREFRLVIVFEIMAVHKSSLSESAQDPYDYLFRNKMAEYMCLSLYRYRQFQWN
jgi:hypothetical protein